MTVGVKAFNEERHIARSLASAVDAVRSFGGEVILADSGSTDRTIDIARGFPVRIMQLANVAERRCGASAQLAFQHSRGDYFYILDGDMVFDREFLSAGIAYLEANPQTVGVGGHVVEMTEGTEFQIRAKAAGGMPDRQPGIVDRLEGGGLYRAAPLRDIGYFADRNLHAFEEFELAARLGSRGWKLARLDRHAADHYGHATGGYRLLWRRLRSGYSDGAGEVLRSAIGRPHLRFVVARLGHIRNGMAVMLWWLALLIALVEAPWLAATVALVPFAFLSFRRRSLELGLYSLASWNVSAWGLLRGLFRNRQSPLQPIASIELSGRSICDGVAEG